MWNDVDGDDMIGVGPSATDENDEQPPDGFTYLADYT